MVSSFLLLVFLKCCHFPLDVILDGLLKQKDEIIGCKKVPVKQKEQAQLLREQREQERELSNLKAKLIELEKQKKAYEEGAGVNFQLSPRMFHWFLILANKGLLQETKEVLVALEKAVKKYSKSFLMDLSVESGEDAITCKIRFNEQPECCAFFEIDRKRKEVICRVFSTLFVFRNCCFAAFHTRGLPTSVGNQLEQKFAKHRNTSQILVDFRNVIMKM